MHSLQTDRPVHVGNINALVRPTGDSKGLRALVNESLILGGLEKEFPHVFDVREDHERVLKMLHANQSLVCAVEELRADLYVQ